MSPKYQFEENKQEGNAVQIFIIIALFAFSFLVYFVSKTNKEKSLDCEPFRFKAINDVPASCYSYFK